MSEPKRFIPKGHRWVSIADQTKLKTTLIDHGFTVPSLARGLAEAYPHELGSAKSWEAFIRRVLTSDIPMTYEGRLLDPLLEALEPKEAS